MPAPNYGEVIRVIEHYLQYDGRGGIHPYESHEEAADAMEPGDAERALVAIGQALDRVKGAS